MGKTGESREKKNTDSVDQTTRTKYEEQENVQKKI